VVDSHEDDSVARLALIEAVRPN